MTKYNIENITMNKKEVERVCKYKTYPRDSKMLTDKGLVNIDNRSQGGTHWTIFIVKDNNLYDFDSFGGQPENFLLNQLPPLIIYHSYKIQDINSKLCGSYCLYFFHLIERMISHDILLKMYSEKM